MDNRGYTLDFSNRAPRRQLSRRPVRIAAEESLHHANLVRHYQTKSDADQAGDQRQFAAEGFESVPHKSECGCDAHGDQHHAGDCAYAEHQQIGDRPGRIADAGEDEQSDRRRSGEPVHDAYDQRAESLIERGLAQSSIEARERILLRVSVLLVRVHVRMSVNVIAVTVGVRMNRYLTLASVKLRCRHGMCEADQIPDSQQDQHEAYRKLHGQTDTRGDHKIKENDGAAYDKDRQRVAKSPENADQGGALGASLLGDNCGYRDYMVGIGGVPHSEEKSDHDDGEQADHYFGSQV